MDVQNRVIIVTGASQGIGLATARHLSQQGAKVVLVARSSELLKNLENELTNSLAIVADVTKASDRDLIVKKTLEKYGRVDILINNAGQGMYGSVETMNLEHYQKIMDLNVHSALALMQIVIPIMRKQGGGMIMNVSSGLTRMHMPGLAAYSSTKYALNSLSFTARQELEKDNIIVSVVTPKLTSTNFGKNALGARPDWYSNRSAPSDRPTPGVDTPEKVADVIAKLIDSEEAEAVL